MIQRRGAMQRRGGAVLVACTVLLAGCASSQARTDTRTPASMHAPGSASPGAAMTPGMVMPDGSTMGPARAKEISTGPSAATRMICSAEVRGDITTVLALKSVARSTPSWRDHLYTCTYRLPMGALVLSVKQSDDSASAKRYAAGLRNRLGQTHALAGLTSIAFATSTGTVALVKDNDTLQVDATRLPAQFGSQQQKRNDFAYEIASTILGCWTGD